MENKTPSEKKTIMPDNLVLREGTTLQISSDTSKSGGVVIQGLALPFNKHSRNGVKYTEKSVTETHWMLEGRSLLWNHDPNVVVGHVESVWIPTGEVTNQQAGLHYRADINPNVKINNVPLVDMIKRKDVNNVSITILPDRETVKEIDGNRIEVDVVDWIELSIVSTPGFSDTSIDVLERLHEMARLDTEGKEKFAGYDNMEDCKKQNQDKESPGGYCADIHKKATGNYPRQKQNLEGEPMTEETKKKKEAPVDDEDEEEEESSKDTEERLKNIETLLIDLAEKQKKEQDDDEDEDEDEEEEKKGKETFDAESIERRLTEIESILTEYSPFLEKLKESYQENTEPKKEEKDEDEEDEDDKEKESVPPIKSAEESVFKSSITKGEAPKNNSKNIMLNMCEMIARGR